MGWIMHKTTKSFWATCRKDKPVCILKGDTIDIITQTEDGITFRLIKDSSIYKNDTFRAERKEYEGKLEEV